MTTHNVTYARTVHLSGASVDEARERATHAFGMEGFRVVAEIDLRESLKRNLDKDVGPYRLVEICRPDLADRALAIDKAAGLLMPCKIGIWKDGQDAVVSALLPESANAGAGDERLRELTHEAEVHIDRAIDRLVGEA